MAGARATATWQEAKEVLTVVRIRYAPSLESQLLILLSSIVYFTDIEGVLKEQLKGLSNPRLVEQQLGMLEVTIAGAKRRLESDAKLYVLGLRADEPQTARDKQQKFGILDAQPLLAEDIATTHGPLGRAVLYIDIDDFKAVNTSLTEVRVDALVLPVIHRFLAEVVRSIGHAYAEGGDEMTIYLPNCTQTFAIEVGHAVRKGISELSFGAAAAHTKVTVSVGVAYAAANSPSENLVLEANEAKQLAKGKGKNRIEPWGGS
ncbi:hypothetical protein DSM104443_01790 [Usitatibacter rugosus]|uniref:diguanylate cyclase n=1 Tax=Usitatibacter rugosus TaxID=2732067 RepID=A0A6M4GTT4_9PROT|nr:hypothetical protein DSM104443_01790 [Usitatibacter rugosus]